MSAGIFQNGNRRIARLVIFELACGLGLMAIMQIQGHIPSLDITPQNMKLISFWLAVSGTILKSLELFFSKTAGMFKSGNFDLESPPVPPIKDIPIFPKPTTPPPTS